MLKEDQSAGHGMGKGVSKFKKGRPSIIDSLPEGLDRELLS